MKRFIEILRSDKSLEAKEAQIEKLVEEATQSIISEQFRFEKDADGRTIAGSIDPLTATYRYREGAAANALDLMNPAGGTVQEAINSKILTRRLNVSAETDSPVAIGRRVGNNFAIISCHLV